MLQTWTGPAFQTPPHTPGSTQLVRWADAAAAAACCQLLLLCRWLWLCEPPPTAPACSLHCCAACCVAGELKDSLFDGLRRPRRSGCNAADAALAAAPGAYIPQEELFAAAGAAAAAASNVPELEALGRGVCRELLLHQQERPHYAGIGPECPLMARKFSDQTVKVRKRRLAGALLALANAVMG